MTWLVVIGVIVILQLFWIGRTVSVFIDKFEHFWTAQIDTQHELKSEIKTLRYVADSRDRTVPPPSASTPGS